eukprot:12484807-Ditylum_brightwellii.AAC.1
MKIVKGFLREDIQLVAMKESPIVVVLDADMDQKMGRVGPISFYTASPLSAPPICPHKQY